MERLTLEQMGRIAPFFEGQEDTLIRSCLQGHMGEAWADSAEAPRSAQIVVADFCFLGGAPNRELAGHVPADHTGQLLILDPPGGWGELLREHWGELVTIEPRYAFEKQAEFDRDALRGFAARIPEGYRLERFTPAACEIALREAWSRDFVSNFASAEDFLARGRGVAVWRGGALVGAASSYTVYDGGIEIEIGIHRDHRRQGLATACAAALILDCLDAGLFPSWDAANLKSAGLAKKLGYRYKGEYPTYLLHLHRDAPADPR